MTIPPKNAQTSFVDNGYKDRGYRQKNGVSELAGAPTKLRMIEYEDDEGVLRYKLVSSKIKFDDEAQATFLEQIADHGRLGTAARAAGVTITTARRHVSANREFAEAFAEAIECYRDRLLNHHQNLVFNGVQKETYDRNGSLVSVETNYPIRLIELELKKHDEGYRDKREVTHDVKGGVLVAPGHLSAEDWENQFGKKDIPDVIDAEVVSDDEDDQDE